jgi:hypothetical protein
MCSIKVNKKNKCIKLTADKMENAPFFWNDFLYEKFLKINKREPKTGEIFEGVDLKEWISKQKNKLLDMSERLNYFYEEIEKYPKPKYFQSIDFTEEYQNRISMEAMLVFLKNNSRFLKNINTECRDSQVIILFKLLRYSLRNIELVVFCEKSMKNKTFKEIGVRLGFSGSYMHRVLKDGMKKINHPKFRRYIISLVGASNNEANNIR